MKAFMSIGLITVLGSILACGGPTNYSQGECDTPEERESAVTKFIIERYKPSSLTISPTEVEIIYDVEFDTADKSCSGSATITGDCLVHNGKNVTCL